MIHASCIPSWRKRTGECEHGVLQGIPPRVRAGRKKRRGALPAAGKRSLLRFTTQRLRWGNPGGLWVWIQRTGTTAKGKRNRTRSLARPNASVQGARYQKLSAAVLLQ